jgi:hypothetical protein
MRRCAQPLVLGDYAQTKPHPLDEIAVFEATMMLLQTLLANYSEERCQSTIDGIIKNLPRKVAMRRAEIQQHLHDYGPVIEEILKAKEEG